MKKNQKIMAYLLSTALTALMVCPVHAEDWKSIGNSDNGANVSQVLSETYSELSHMSPEEDYDAKSAFVAVDSYEEAEKAAAFYNAELTDYKYGIATLSLKKDIRNVLKDAKAAVDSLDEDSETPYILYPQTKMRLYDTNNARRSAPGTNDPRLNEQWFHSKINTGDAWKTAKGSGALVVVIDSGVRGTHNDLRNNISGNEAIITSGSGGSYYGNDIGISRRPGNDPGDGSGGSGSNNNSENNDMEDGHGTHVSGLVAADEDNGCCGAGVAPDAGVYMIKVCQDTQSEDEDEFNFSDVISGINRAVELRAHVINLSLGAPEGAITTSEIDLLQSTITNAYNAGITVIAAAGNDATREKDYPGCLDHVINVGAITNSNALADFSNYGQYVDICAPGSSIISTVASGDDAMESMDGTSMASPIVAGVAALVYSANSSLLNGHNSTVADNVSNILQSSTDGVEYKYGNHIVTGCINAATAVEKSAKGDFSSSGEDMGNGYVFKEKGTGFLASTGKNASNPIAPGKTLKLQICDKDGNPVKEAKKNKNVTWSLSNTQDFSIKNGKLKCFKSASTGADTYVYAEFGGKKTSARFSAVRKTLAVGFYDNDGKFKSKITLERGYSSNTAISVNNCNVLTSNEIMAFYTKPSSHDSSYNGSYYPGDGGGGYYSGDGGSGYYPGDGGGGYYPGDGGGYYPGDGGGGYYPGDGGYWRADSSGYVSAVDAGYAIKVNKTKSLGSVVRDANGNIISFVPLKSGTYTVTYTTIDGGNKKFKVKIKIG